MSKYSYPRTRRMVSKRDFQAAYAARVRMVAGPLQVHVRPNDLPHCRLGLAVPVAVGTAVVRNRIKRQLREAFRLMQHDLPPGYDVAVTVRPHPALTVGEYQLLIGKAVKQGHETWTKRARP